MGFRADLEVGKGQFVKIELGDGMSAGKALSAFIIPVYLACSGEADEETAKDIRDWITSMNLSVESFKEYVQLTYHSFCDQSWNYGFGDYARYSEEHEFDRLSEEDFLRAVRAIDDTWVDTFLLYYEVGALRDVLAEKRPQDMWWYELDSIIDDLSALYKALDRAMLAGAEQVRIAFH